MATRWWCGGGGGLARPHAHAHMQALQSSHVIGMGTVGTSPCSFDNHSHMQPDGGAPAAQIQASGPPCAGRPAASGIARAVHRPAVRGHDVLLLVLAMDFATRQLNLQDTTRS